MYWHPFDKSIKHNPYEHYRQQSQIASVFEAPGNVIYVLDYNSTKEFLTRSVPYSSSQPKRPTRFDLDTFNRLMQHCLFIQEGSNHHKNRYTASRAFDLSQIEIYADRKVSELTNSLKDKVEFDIMADLAIPFAIQTITYILGFDQHGTQKAEYWAEALFKSVDIFSGSNELNGIEEAAKELENYLQALVAENNVSSHSFISRYHQILSRLHKDEEIVKVQLNSMVSTILMTGIDTTVGAMGNSIYSLLTHPSKWQLLKSDLDGLLFTSIEELLRFDTPVQFMFRIISEDHKINGLNAKKGQVLAACLGSANRDPGIFDRADELILDRNVNPHISFGVGQHYCFGAKLARIELATFLKSIINSFPNLSLTEERPLYKNYNFLKVPSQIKVVNNSSISVT